MTLSTDADVEAPEALEAKGFRLTGYTDLDSRPPFKLATQRVDDRGVIFCSDKNHGLFVLQQD